MLLESRRVCLNLGDDFDVVVLLRAMRETENSVKKEDNSSVSIASDHTKYSPQYTSLTKIVMINEYDKMIFVRYNSYIMLPWFTISNILNRLDEEKIKHIVKDFFFAKKIFLF
jgi:hypothetical protein